MNIRPPPPLKDRPQPLSARGIKKFYAQNLDFLIVFFKGLAVAELKSRNFGLSYCLTLSQNMNCIRLTASQIDAILIFFLVLGQVWRTLDVGPSKKIETGLSFLFVGIDKMNSNYLLVDGERKFKHSLDIRRWISVSVGPTGIWLLAEATNALVLWINNANAKDSNISPREIDGLLNDTIKDIDVGPTGLVFIRSGRSICSRIGINDTQPEGSGWNCIPQNAELLSSGIDGCFFVNGINITYQPENKTQKMQQFFTPFQNHIEDIDAGLNYELWVVTDSHDVYRRIGTSARLPWGSYWELVPGIQLNTISIGIFGPVGRLASSGSNEAVTVILNGKNKADWLS